MNGKTYLCDINCGKKCRVLNLLAKGSVRRRLHDLGVIRGAEIECVLKSPLGDPFAFIICGAVLALRREDSELVEVEVI